MGGGGGGPRCRRGSAHLERNDHFKNGNIYFEGLLIVQVFHRIGAVHFSHFRAEVAAADILVPLSRLEDGLDADDALPFYFAVAAIAIEYMPMPAV